MLPSLFQQAGWLYPLLSMILAVFLSQFSGLALLKSSQLSKYILSLTISSELIFLCFVFLVPGNSNFDKRFEYANITRHYVGGVGFIVICSLLIIFFVRFFLYSLRYHY
jgi:hypothetical protein